MLFENGYFLHVRIQCMCIYRLYITTRVIIQDRRTDATTMTYLQYHWSIFILKVDKELKTKHIEGIKPL